MVVKIKDLQNSLSRYNTFKIYHSENDIRIPNPFMCNAIKFEHLECYDYDCIIFKRRFVSDISICRSIVSVLLKINDDHSAVFILHMQNGLTLNDDLTKDSIITIEASYDDNIYIPTESCKIDNSNIIGTKQFEYLKNPSFYDPNRSCPDDGLYVIDPNRLGIMTHGQEYIFENFMRFNLEQECYHDVLKTVCFMVKDWEVSIGLYNLESNAIEEMYGLDEIY